MKVSSGHNLRYRKSSLSRNEVPGMNNFSSAGGLAVKASKYVSKNTDKTYGGFGVNSSQDPPLCRAKSPALSDISEDADLALGTSPNDVSLGIYTISGMVNYFRSQSPVCASIESPHSASTSRSYDFDLGQMPVVKSKEQMFVVGTKCNTVFKNWLEAVGESFVEVDVINFLAALHKDQLGKMKFNKDALNKQGTLHYAVLIIIGRLRENSFNPNNCIMWQNNFQIDHILSLRDAFVDLDKELMMFKG